MAKSPLETMNHLNPEILTNTLADTLSEHEAKTYADTSRNVEAKTVVDTLANTLKEAEAGKNLATRKAM